MIFSFNFADEPAISIHKCPSPITEGSNTTLYCNATGNPVPVVAWIYQETGVIVSSTEELVLTSIDHSQAGSYKCHAFNGIGSNSTRKCSLDVFCKYDLLYTVIITSKNTMSPYYIKRFQNSHETRQSRLICSLLSMAS